MDFTFITFPYLSFFRLHLQFRVYPNFNYHLCLLVKLKILNFCFSRLASGIISPSEIPDSPTQIVAHSPRRLPGTSVSFPCTPPNPLRSVFEDNVNMFGVENTPAQFSCATSLSNLSLDDEPKIETDITTKELKLLSVEDDAAVKINKKSNDIQSFDPSNVDDTQIINADLSDSDDRDDEILLESCMNMGMDRIVRSQNVKESNECNQNDLLSDDSSNSSSENERSLLDELMRGGLAKSTKSNARANFSAPCVESLPRHVYKENPINMLKKGGISTYAVSKDEMNRFNVEDSPCSFSVMSELSDITVGSSVAGLVPVNR